MLSTLEVPRNPVLVALVFAVIIIFVWLIFAHSAKLPLERRVSTVAISRTGRWLAAGTARGRITIWDQTSSLGPQELSFTPGELNDLQFSHDEQTLAIAAGNLGLLALTGSATPRLLREDGRNYGSARFSPDDEKLLVITGRGNLEVIEVASGALRVQACCSSVYGEAAFTPDGQMIASAGHWPSLWNATSGKLLARLTRDRQTSTYRPIAFDTRAETVVMGSQDGRVYVWSLATRQLKATSPPQQGYVDTLAVSPAGWVIFAGFGNQIKLWNPESQERGSVPAAQPASNVVLAPDGYTILFGTAHRSVEAWSLETQRHVHTWKLPGG